MQTLLRSFLLIRGKPEGRAAPAGAPPGHTLLPSITSEAAPGSVTAPSHHGRVGALSRGGKSEGTERAARRLPFNRNTEKEKAMLGWAITFLIVALIAALLGFGGIAGAASSIAQILFFVFIVLFIVAMIARAVRGQPPV